MFPFTFADGPVHRFSDTEVTSYKCSSSDDPVSPLIRAACIVTWALDERVCCVLTGALAHLGLSQRSNEDAPSVPPAIPVILVDVRDVDLNAKGD